MQLRAAQLMRPVGPVTSSGILLVDLFSLNFSSWTEVSTDPSAGANIVALGQGRFTVNNTTDNSLSHAYIDFYFVRQTGGVGSDFVMNGIVNGTGFSATSTGVSPSHIHKLQFSGTAGKTQIISGLVIFDVHY